MALLCPQTLREISKMDGWGQERLLKFGNEFLECVNLFFKENNIELPSIDEEKALNLDVVCKGWNVEYAKTGRGKCFGCGNLIPAGKMRIMKAEEPRGWKRGFHPECSARHETKGVQLTQKKLKGMDELTKEDKADLLNTCFNSSNAIDDTNPDPSQFNLKVI
jgi:hypothetical protein